MAFLPIPAIDLMDGCVVRLRRGRAEEKTIYSRDPAEVARGFEQAGAPRLHVVDLNGAFGGGPRNSAAVASIAEAVQMQIELGGGLRTETDVAQAFDLGVHYAIVGTSAVRDRSFVERLVGQYGAKIIVGVDAKDGHVAVEGWVETSDLDQIEFIGELEAIGVATIVATDIATDGMMTGPNLESLSAVASATRMNVIASGGVRNLEDLRSIRALNCANLTGANTGRADYEGTLDVAQAIADLAD